MSTTTEIVALPADAEAQIAQVTREIPELVRRAGEMQVRDDREAGIATEFLAQVTGRKRTIEKERRGIVDPINEGVKRINDRMKAAQAPLEEASRIVREKMEIFLKEQERLRLEAEAELRKIQERQQREADQRKAEEEREAQEARERAETEAAEAEDREREAEAARVAAREGLAGEMADLTTIDLTTLIQTSHLHTPERVAAARQEMEIRRQHRQAEDEAQKAQERADAAREAEEATLDRPAAQAPLVEIPKGGPIRTSTGSASTRKRWVGDVTDAAAVPRVYLIPDQKAINEAIKNGVREIPGVNIHEVTDLAVRTR